MKTLNNFLFYSTGYRINRNDRLNLSPYQNNNEITFKVQGLQKIYRALQRVQGCRNFTEFCKVQDWITRFTRRKTCRYFTEHYNVQDSIQDLQGDMLAKILWSFAVCKVVMQVMQSERRTLSLEDHQSNANLTNLLAMFGNPWENLKVCEIETFKHLASIVQPVQAFNVK